MLLAASSAFRPPCGMENGLWEKSIFFSSSFHSYIGKSTIQASANWSSLTSFSSVPILRARLASEPVELLRVAGGEEHRIADLEAELLLHRRPARSGPMFFATGPAPPSSPSRQKM